VADDILEIPRGVLKMATERINDPRAFRDFLDAKLTNGGAALSLDEYLDLWHHENSSEQDREETLQAIRRGLADIEAGNVRPFEEFDHEFRHKHGLPGRA
jgi:hypothetical protein